MSQSCVYRKTVKGKKQGYYRARLHDQTGRWVDRLVELPNGGKTKDKSVAQQWLTAEVVRVQRLVAGLDDVSVENLKREIRPELDRYIEWRRKKRISGEKQTTSVLARIKWIIATAGMERLSDFNAEKIDDALGTLATDRSVKTVNEYRAAAHSFGGWLVRTAKLLEHNPLLCTDRMRDDGDGYERGTLTVDEVYALLAASPPDRAKVYAFLIWTGARCDEARKLEWRDVDLGDRPCVVFRPTVSKARRRDEIPLHPDIASMLREHKPAFATPTNRVFASIPTLRTFRGGDYTTRRRDGKVKTVHQTGDLERAGIALETSQSRCVDRHSMRTTFATWLIEYGVDADLRDFLTRHSKKSGNVRASNYTPRSAFDMWVEIEKLPPIRREIHHEEDRQTGTCDMGSGALAPQLAPTGVFHRPKRSATVRLADDVTSVRHDRSSLQYEDKVRSEPLKEHWAARTRTWNLLDQSQNDCRDKPALQGSGTHFSDISASASTAVSTKNQESTIKQITAACEALPEATLMKVLGYVEALRMVNEDR